MIFPAQIIKKKRDGKKLEKQEIYEFIQGICTGDIADYQTSALLMAIYFQGMSIDETAILTQAMLESGIHYDYSNIKGPKLNKYSTGGIGDKISLILTPLAAACGLKIPMLSRRALGYTGGTLDKLESIPGLNTQLSENHFKEILKDVGCVISSQTEKMTPADQKIYSLRDVTESIECIPLIIASILSKKLAEGLDGLLLDVKVGSGAFIKTQKIAKKLAKKLLQVSKKMNLPCKAILTEMHQPLGYAVGNAIEMKEAFEVLKNQKTPEYSSIDLKELTLQFCAQMLLMGKLSQTLTEAKKLAQDRLADGSAWRVFQKLITAQGGTLLPKAPNEGLTLAPHRVTWTAKKKGYLNRMNVEEIGKILLTLGAGRQKITDSIDHGVGLAFHKKLGSKISLGEPLVKVYAQAQAPLEALEKKFHACLEINATRKATPKLILEHLN